MLGRRAGIAKVGARPSGAAAMPEMMGAPPMAPPPGAPAPIPAGPTGPATTAPKPAGMEARVPMLVDAAMKPLRDALRLLDPVGPAGQALHKAMVMLAKEFGVPSPDMTRADLKLMGEQAGTASPSNPAAFADMMRQIGANRAGQP